jgi:uncharacterized SAM-binding protein YcdF (DUF218 family)
MNPMHTCAKTLIRLTMYSLAFVGAIAMIVTLTPIVSWYGAQLAGPWNDPDGEILVLLGGSIEDDGTMGESSYRRSLYAAYAFRQGSFRHLVISGGGINGNPVAESMRQYLSCRGIPADAIHTELYSRNTRENALYTKPILSTLVGRKVLLTSDYHMARAYRVFRKSGIDVSPRPFPDAIKRGGSIRSRWGAFVDVVWETGALGYYRARGWI